MAQTKPKAGQFYGVSNNGTDGQFLKTDGTGGMSWDSPITNPTITSIDYPGSATAADPAGGESVIINGTLFASGITCTVGGTSAVTAFNSATQITITTPAKAAGQYTVAVTNPDGGTVSQLNFIQYSGVPVWSTASGSLGSVQEGATASFQVTATEGSDTIEYAVTTGSLPTGLSLATATGAITGTAGSVSADTTTTFSITATDDENQTSSERSFNITVTNDNPSNYFNTVLYTGTGASSMSITGVGFQPDFVWIKRRNGGGSHYVFDVVRGVYKGIFPDATYAESNNSSYLTSFDSDGFSLGSNGALVGSSQTYVAWCFKAGGAAVANTDGTISTQVSVNTTLGFSIVQWTGTRPTAGTLGHGLGLTPEMIIIKNTSITSDWTVYAENEGPTKHGILDTSGAWVSNAGAFNNTSPTSNVFTVGGDAYTNGTGNSIIAYCFTSKPGFSKVGSYTGNGSANGPIVQTGFEPAFLMIKESSSSGNNWVIYDNKRDPINSRYKYLSPNTTDSEGSNNASNYPIVNFLSNGFELAGTDGRINTTGSTYIYLAFAANPSTTTPSLANSFGAELMTGNGSSQTVNTGFKPDFIWQKFRNISYDHNLMDSVRSNFTELLQSNTTASQSTNTGVIASTSNTGFTTGTSGIVTSNGQPMVFWSWKAGGLGSINTDGTITGLVSANQAAGFSISKYNHTTTSGTFSVGHGLGAAPELVFFKCLATSNSSWLVYYATDETQLLVLDASGAASPATSGSASYWSTSPSSSVFNFGTAWATNYSYYAGPSIMYSFKSITGYSKVGTYTGTANSNPQSTGFQPGFVMIKRTDSTGSWLIFDSERGAQNELYANLSDSEYNAGSGSNSLSATGFTPQISGNWNINGATYIYLAIKEN